MKLLLVLLALIVAISFAETEQKGLSDVASLLSRLSKHPKHNGFKSFKNKFRKNYSENSEEHAKRFQTYLDNLAKIDKLNLESDGAVFGENSLTDLTSDEFVKLLGFSEGSNKRNVEEESQTGLPRATKITSSTASFDSWDWCSRGVCGPIKNQAQCGSCWAHATTSAVEAVVALETGTSVVELSQQQLIDCYSSSKYGCNGGPMALDWVVQNGLTTTASYPPTSNKSPFTAGSCKGNSYQVKLTGWGQLQTTDENVIANDLSANSPLLIAVDASKWQYYVGGSVMTSDTCAFSQYNHAVLLVGYDKKASTPYWKIQNSWGTGWGENGFIRIEFGKNTCGVKSDPTNYRYISVPFYEGADTTGTPTPVQPPVPTPVQPVPTPVQPVPTPVQPVPTPVQPVPTPVQPVPTPVQPVPTPVQSPPSSTSNCRAYTGKVCIPPPSNTPFAGLPNCFDPRAVGFDGRGYNYCFVDGEPYTYYSCTCTSRAMDSPNLQYSLGPNGTPVEVTPMESKLSPGAFTGIGVAVGVLSTTLVAGLAYFIYSRKSSSHVESV